MTVVGKLEKYQTSECCVSDVCDFSDFPNWAERSRLRSWAAQGSPQWETAETPTKQASLAACVGETSAQRGTEKTAVGWPRHAFHSGGKIILRWFEVIPEPRDEPEGRPGLNSQGGSRRAALGAN